MSSARRQSAIESLLREWHPQWLTRNELALLAPSLAKVPGKVISQELARMHRAGSIRVEQKGSVERIYWNEGDDE